MFTLTLPWWELVLRGACIYFAVLVLLRVVGKRQVGELAPFDIVLLTLISAASSRALDSEDSSVTAAMIVIITMLLLNGIIVALSNRSKRIDRVVEGRPTLLIKNGRVDYTALRREMVTKSELLAALREEGCFTPHQAEYAVLETTGQISVRRRTGQARS